MAVGLLVLGAGVDGVDGVAEAEGLGVEGVVWGATGAELFCSGVGPGPLDPPSGELAMASPSTAVGTVAVTRTALAVRLRMISPSFLIPMGPSNFYGEYRSYLLGP